MSYLWVGFLRNEDREALFRELKLDHKILVSDDFMASGHNEQGYYDTDTQEHEVFSVLRALEVLAGNGIKFCGYFYSNEIDQEGHYLMVAHRQKLLTLPAYMNTGLVAVAVQGNGQVTKKHLREAETYMKEKKRLDAEAGRNKKA